MWTTLLIATITSGCAGNQLTLPLCLDDRPPLEDITVVEQLQIKEISEDLLRRVAVNDANLKSWVSTTERLTATHNEQFEAECP